MTDIHEGNRVMNVSQAANYSGYSRGSIEYWMRECKLPYESPPSQGRGVQKRKFIRTEDFDQFLNDHYSNQKESKEEKKMNLERTGLTLLSRNQPLA